MRLAAIVECTALGVWLTGAAATDAQPNGESPYLLLFAGDQDEAESDFLAVVDVQTDSPKVGRVVATTPVGMRGSIPHHMEYALPPAGERLYVNAHQRETTMLVDVSDPRSPRVMTTFQPPTPFRFTHDYYRTPSGSRLVGFLRSEGDGPNPAETATPGNHGGIAEYSAEGRLLRTTSAATSGSVEAVRPYAFALLEDLDRLVVTSAPMMESTWADVVQIYRYSDFELLRTIDLPTGRLPDGTPVEGSQRAGFGPRVLADGSVLLNAYGCAFYRLTNIDDDRPMLETVLTLDTPKPADESRIRGSCGIPIVFDDYWLMPVGQLHAVVVLDIADPAAPKEVFRLSTPETFNPHWLARDPQSNRLVLGAELGGEEGFYLLRFDNQAGRLSFDPGVEAEGKPGYVSLTDQDWPHGTSGPAWGHAALFLPGQ